MPRGWLGAWRRRGPSGSDLEVAESVLHGAGKANAAPASLEQWLSSPFGIPKYYLF